MDVVSSPARRTRAGEHLYTTRMALHAETSDLSVVAAEFRATLDTLGVTQRRAARLFNVSPRHIRRWQRGDRNVPHTVGLVVNLLAAGVITVSQAEAAAPVPALTNGSTKDEPPAEPASDQSASACTEVGALADLSPAAAAVVTLDARSCRFPLGNPQDRDFCFCNDPVIAPPYCTRHRAMAYLAPRTGSGHGFRVGFVAHRRQPRPQQAPAPASPSSASAFSTTGTAHPPAELAGGLPR